MKFSARISNGPGRHEVEVTTGDDSPSLRIAAKADGRGSSVNGGELLLLALATCYANDLYREAETLDIAIDGVEAEAECEFSGIGKPAKEIVFRARVKSSESRDRIRELLVHTDRVAEIQRTVREGVSVRLEL